VVALKPNILRIILNVNGIKTLNLKAEIILLTKKQGSIIYCQEEKYLKYNGKYVQWKRTKKIYQLTLIKTMLKW
jgi:hypothetical protein